MKKFLKMISEFVIMIYAIVVITTIVSQVYHEMEENEYYGISNYYIDATVLKNGDLYVKELIVLEGNYNGFNKILTYTNLNATKFNGDVNSFFCSDIYDAGGVELLKVQAIKVKEKEGFNNLYNKGVIFNETKTASKGDFGIYTVNHQFNELDMLIYNPDSKKHKGFYLEYKLKDLAINHKDISELGFNIIGTNLTEDVKELTLKLNIPNNKNLIKVWGHGPLNGETKIIDKNNVQLKISNLKENNAVDTRIVFDKNSVNAIKKTKVDAYEKIIEVETIKAIDANKEREKAYRSQVLTIKQKIEKLKQDKKMSKYNDVYNKVILLRDGTDKTSFLNELEVIYKDIKKEQKIFLIVQIICLIILILLLIRYYRKYDKEHIASFKGTHYRDFPKEYRPEIVYYLFHKEVKPICLSATLLNLIDRKIIKYEKQENDYSFTSNIDLKRLEQVGLTQAEVSIMNWLFVSKSRGNQISLSTLKKEANTSYKKFLSNYRDYEKAVIKEAESYQLFWQNHSIGKYILASILIGFSPVWLSTNGETDVLSFVTVTLAVISILYYLNSKKRTKSGNEDYAKWKGLKRFIENFGRFEERDLPQIELWNKYLVYALVFGSANKLAKEMELKVEGLNLDTTLIDYQTFTMFEVLNKTLETSVKSARNKEYKANSSSSSSGGGSGGGFSSGGGGFSGGSGGGRF